MTEESAHGAHASSPAASGAAAARSGFDPRRDRLADPGRVVMLSDGVFAIVITILVLDLAVPEGLTDQSLGPFLAELRPSLFAWVISFLIIGNYWVSHRDLFARVRRVTRGLVWLNLLFLLPVCLIPFAASVLGKYQDEPVAVRLYGVVLILAAVMRVLLYWYVVRRPAVMWPDSTDPRVGLGLAIAAAPIAFYALAMALADVSSGLSIALYFSAPLLYILLVTLLRGRSGTRAEADEFT